MILRRMPALDGLRGVAVLLVVAEHTFDRRLAHAGRFGVAVFFVLSGYLITSLLLAEHASTGRLDLRAFWARRAVRLGPAFALFLVVLPVLMALAGDPDLPLYPLMALVAGTYTTDLFAAYLDVDLRGLAHTWSLAVEEQFYLLWPLLLLALLRLARGRPDALRTGVWAVVGVLAVVRGVLTWRADPLHVYYAPETSAFALAVGCALAVDPRARGVLARAGRPALVALVAVALLIGTVSGSPDMRVTNDLMPLVVLLSACVVAAGTGPFPFLENRMLRALGTVSYGVYLWHLGLLELGPGELTGVPALAADVAAVAVAAASYRWLERPLRRAHARRRSTDAPPPTAYLPPEVPALSGRRRHRRCADVVLTPGPEHATQR